MGETNVCFSSFLPLFIKTMNFKYDLQINKNYWKYIVKNKGMFGLKFPDKVLITKEEEKLATTKLLEFLNIWNRDEEIRSTILRIYEYKLPKTLNCYIVTTKTSAVDIEKESILLSMHAPVDKIPMVIIHEFSHIAFLKRWKDYCQKIGYTQKGIQNLKEILTVINNTEYKDIEDRGYSIHQEARKLTEELWQKSKSLSTVIENPQIMEISNSL